MLSGPANPVMSAQTSPWQPHLDLAGERLEAWDIEACRAACAKARALAASWGDAPAVAYADLLSARAALLVSSSPSATISPPPPGDACAAAAALPVELDAEIALAKGDACTRALPSLSSSSPKEAIAAAALVALSRFVDPRATPMRIPGAAAIASRADAGGFAHLVVALDAEASGASGLSAVERALAEADERGSRALAWAALTTRAALCARRGATSEEEASRVRLAAMLESWLLTLPPSDASSARARPDRRRILEPRGSIAAASLGRLVDVALALGQERDVNRLVNLALDAAVAEAHAERGVLVLMDAKGVQTIAATRFVDDAASERGVLGLSSSLARRAIEAGEIIVSNDVRVDRRLSTVESLAADVTSVLCAPIVARAAVEGAIYLDRRFQGSPFDDEAVTAVRAIGAMLASALVTARTVADLETRTRELEAARAELADALAARTQERDRAQRELAEVRDHLPAGSTGLVGRGAAMQRLVATIRRVGASDVPVLIAGETGSGKELVARAIHEASARRDRPLVALNCGALSESLLEAELFGAEKGAYTSAVTARQGVMVAADGGTLFLDEVGDMPLAMQVALLRVLETGEVRPVGSTKSRKVDVRILAASHRDLVELEGRGAFRADLRYRLEVVRIVVPPLRDRLEDLPELCAHLLSEVRVRYNLPMRRVSREALDVLRARRWPGNVRELRHVLASAALSANDEVILPGDLPAERSSALPSDVDPAAAAAATAALPEDGHAARVDAIRRALRSTAGRRGRAAQLLGLSRSTFYRYLELYKIDPDELGAPPGENDEP
jgi:transcriptional regulator with GAF, ATPase, and Fis domain